MQTIFDKIYVITAILSKERQKSIKYQLDNLGIDFEFIYGIDFYNIKHDRFNNIINYPNMVLEYNHMNNDGVYGAAMSHYKAILLSYELGYNNVLIIEDDACFINDIKLIENYFNNIPEDADFITYTPRFMEYYEYNKFNDYILKNKNNKYIILDKSYNSLCGNGMYAILNRDVMKKYIDNQRIKFTPPDHVSDIFKNVTINRYVSVDAIMIDQYNLLRQNKNHKFINETNCYKQCNIVKDYSLYYNPSKFNISNLHKLLEKSL